MKRDMLKKPVKNYDESMPSVYPRPTEEDYNRNTESNERPKKVFSYSNKFRAPSKTQNVKFPDSGETNNVTTYKNERDEEPNPIDQLNEEKKRAERADRAIKRIQRSQEKRRKEDQ